MEVDGLLGSNCYVNVLHCCQRFSLPLPPDTCYQCDMQSSFSYQDPVFSQAVSFLLTLYQHLLIHALSPQKPLKSFPGHSIPQSHLHYHPKFSSLSYFSCSRDLGILAFTTCRTLLALTPNPNLIVATTQNTLGSSSNCFRVSKFLLADTKEQYY